MYKLKIVQPRLLKVKFSVSFPPIILANLQEKTVVPLTNEVVVTADDSFDGLSKVTVGAVTSSIDSNITSENIKSGVSILGVEGNYANLEEATATQSDIAEGKTAYISSGFVTGTGKLAPSITKGLRIDTIDANGYVTEATFIGDSLPINYFRDSFTTINFGKNITLNFTDELKSIKTNCFSQCSGLNGIKNYDNITEIGIQAFQNCSNLLLNKLPSSLTSLGDIAFYDCSKITINSTPQGLKIIPSQAFQNCKAITEMTFEGDITYIYTSAFSGATKLTKLSFPNNTSVPPLANINAFQKCPLETIEVPSSLVDSWKSATNWSNYADIIVGI